RLLWPDSLQRNEAKAMDLTYISLEKKDRVAVAWMNKPKANTYDADLMKDLSRTIDAVRFDDDVDICVLASKLDGIWSAGADINLLASSTPDYKAMFCLDCQEILNKMESTPKLFIAAIEILGGDDGRREGFELPAALRPRGRIHQTVRHRRDGDAALRGPRTGTRTPEPIVRDGRREGRVPGLPGEASPEVPRQVIRGAGRGRDSLCSGPVNLIQG